MMLSRAARTRVTTPHQDPQPSPFAGAGQASEQSLDTESMGASSSSMQIPGGFATSPRHHEESEYEYDIAETDLSNVALGDEQFDIAPPSTQTTAPIQSSSPVKGPASDGSSVYSYTSDGLPEEEPDFDISPPTSSQFGPSQPSKPVDGSPLPGSITKAPQPDASLVLLPPVPPGDADIQLSPEQNHVLGLVLQGKSMFFTGSAGTGKSVLLRRIIKTLRDRGTGVSVTASTGIAAMNIQGETLHAFAGVGLGNQERKTLIARAWKTQGVAKKWRDTEVLIIDEISMVAAHWFDDLEAIARSVRKNSDPFGGIQLVICGDFFQLPPVPDYDEAKTGRYTDFAFRAQSWKRAVPLTITLTQVFRQKQPQLIDMLNDMREGRTSEATQHLFRSLSRPVVYPDGIWPTEILPLRRQVQASNQRQLDQIQSKLITFTADDQFFYDSEGKPIRPAYGKTLLDRGIPFSIQLKIGAQVMCVKNIRSSGLVNGSVGKIIDLKTPWEVRNRRSAPSIDNDPTEPALQASGVESPVTTQEAGITSDQANSAHGISNENMPISSEEPKISQSTPPAPRKMNPNYHTRIASDLEPDPSVRDKQPKFRSDGQYGYESTRWPLVEYTNGARVLMGPMKFTHEGPDEQVQACRLQVPLILAWALTVHKSQGQTLERVKVDLAGTFEKGQAYVALSRCTSLEGLEVHNFRPHVVMAHPVY
ncbi:unnamed protein product, partial [Rhizoctonia solani]